MANPFNFHPGKIAPNAEFFASIRELIRSGAYPLYYFGSPTQILYCGMVTDVGEVIQLAAHFPADGVYPSLSSEIPAFHIFERELWEEHGLIPNGHPWLKPLRSPVYTVSMDTDYPFFRSDSPALHEVAVGPVHAGVIESGHFRFVCQGERVEHLEIMLGYQHRGVEKLLVEGDIRQKISLAESIAGDTSIGHGLAYCLAVESLCGVQVNPAVKSIRTIALEMERIAMHLADLSALCGDIAYLSGQSMYAALRTTIINSSLAICGSRFGRRWLCPGGINYGIDTEQNKTLRLTLDKALKQIELVSGATFADSGVLNRFDSTGSLSYKTVKDLNMSGITAKAAGCSRDARRDFPVYGLADTPEPFLPLVQESGDVYARAFLRYREIMQSGALIQYLLSTLPEVKAQAIPLDEPSPERLVISVIEGWRGTIVHALKTNRAGEAELYKVYDPSLHNWFGLALAVRGEGISDFPLCNKSFDLSYCGADL